MAVDTTPQVEALKKKHGALYWLCFNIASALKGFVIRHKFIFIVLAVLALLTGFVLRALLQPFFIALRLHTFDIFLLAALFAGLRIVKRRLAERGKRLRILWKFAALVAVIVLMRCEAYNYMALYCRYQDLQEVDLAGLPLTAHERVQPIVSLRMLADGVMDQNRHPAEPDFVRMGKDFRFTMAIEPDTEYSRLFGTIDEVIDIPGDAASPDFSRNSRDQVKFAIGEHMLFGKNTRTATIKSFDLLRFFSYTPDDVRYMKDNTGQMIEVVSLSRLGGSWWSRWIFPWPEFGGVQIIRQGKGGVLHAVYRLFFGEGEWIPPEDIEKYPYLRGQNLVPYAVSRCMAYSFRFERGLFAPMPYYHVGDTMIPEMPDDRNPQPFTIYAQFGPKGDKRNKLYHYFALEPRQTSQHGLSDSMFVPADGIGQTMVYRHYLRDEGLHGAGAVASQVIGSDLHVDWGHAKPVEHRPWIHVIGGSPRLMWLTTIVVFKDDQLAAGKFSATSLPSLVLTDARSGRSVWVDPTRPDQWESEVEKKFSDMLGKNAKGP